MKVNVVQLELRSLYSLEINGNGYVYGAKDAQDIFADRIGKCNVEHVAMLCMDNTNKIINYGDVAVGGIDSVTTSIGQIIRIALASNASKIIIAHNHPSGVLKITNADISITKHIGAAANLLGIELIDSLVVNANGNIISIRSHIREIEN